MARATRRKMFDMIVGEKMMAGGFHFPFPGLRQPLTRQATATSSSRWPDMRRQAAARFVHCAPAPGWRRRSRP